MQIYCLQRLTAVQQILLAAQTPLTFKFDTSARELLLSLKQY